MGVQRALQAAFVIAVVAMCGCIGFDTVRCEDGRLCPPGGRCDGKGGCLLPAQIAACEGKGLGDGDSCTIDNAPGACALGGCIAYFCGDGIRTDPEECEGADLNGHNCTYLGWSNPDGLACTANCVLDDSACTGGCGDGKIDTNEECDGSVPAGTDCTSLGFYEPDGLTCSGYCRYNVDACKGFCGDGIPNGPEQCDGVPASGQSCLDYSFDAGKLGCTRCAPGFEGCSRLSMQRPTSPTTQILRGFWGMSSDDFYVVGYGGTILHYTGGQLVQVTSPTTQVLNGMWGSSATSAVVVGSAGTMLQLTNGTFSPITAVTANDLTGVWGAGPMNIYAVGASGTIVHYDGTWAATTHGANQLRAVWGSSATNIYAVGSAGTVLHFDGAWTASTILPGSFNSPDLFAVWGSSASDVFFAGKNTSGQAIVIHFDGASTWTTVYTSPTSGTLMAGLWGSGPTDVFAVGTSLLHYDGTRPTQPTPPPGIGVNQLWAVWGLPNGPVWVAGDSGYVARWDGGSWTQPPTLTNTKVRAVASVGSSDMFAVGTTGSPSVGGGERYDGLSWTTLTTPNTQADVMNAVWMANASFGVAVGTNNNAGVVYHFNGSGWLTAPCAAASTSRNAVWGSANGDVYSVGEDDASHLNAIAHWNGACWSNTSFVAPNGKLLLFAIWGSGASDIFAAGQISASTSAVMFHNAGGAAWTQQTLPLPDPAIAQPLTRVDGVWGSSASDVFAVGDGISHYNGSSWVNLRGSGQALKAVSGTGPRNVFAVGSNAKLLHYDGISWTPIRVPVPSAAVVTLRGVAATSRSVVVVGDDGTNGFAQRLSFSLRPSEANCRDGWDDDGNGSPDCADAACAGDDYCTAGGACPRINAMPLQCGGAVAGSTVGRTPARDYYTCDSNPEAGPESIYTFVPTSSGSATVTLSGFGSADLDLVVVGAMQNTTACDPDAACIAASSTSNATEKVTFAAAAGRTYYLIVEGRGSAASQFDLQVTCP